MGETGAEEEEEIRRVDGGEMMSTDSIFNRRQSNPRATWIDDEKREQFFAFLFFCNTMLASLLVDRNKIQFKKNNRHCSRRHVQTTL